MVSALGTVLSIDMRILGAKVVQQQLRNVRVAIETIGRSTTQVSKQFLGLTQRQISGWGRTLKSLKQNNMATLRAKEINEANAAALRTMFGETKKATKAVGTFDMRMLGLMFSGMALQRAFSGVLRSIFNTFQKAEGLTNNLTVATVGITASWEFLKFSIFNALSQSELFMNMINFLIKAINWVSKLINKYPALGIAIITTFGVLAATGAVMMILGQFFLGWAAIFGPGGLLATKAAAGLGDSAAAAGTVTGKVSKAMAAARGIVGGGLLIFGVFQLVKSLTNPSEINFKSALITALTTGLGVGLITANLPAGIAAGIGVLVLLTVSKVKDVGDLVNQQKKTLPEGFTISAHEGVFSRIGDLWDSFLVRISGQRNAYTGHIKNLDASIVTHEDGTKRLTGFMNKNFIPSLSNVNKEFENNISQTDSLIEKYPSLVEQHSNNAAAVSEEAAAHFELAESIRAVNEARTGRGIDEETNADGTGG